MSGYYTGFPVRSLSAARRMQRCWWAEFLLASPYDEGEAEPAMKTTSTTTAAVANGAMEKANVGIEAADRISSF